MCIYGGVRLFWKPDASPNVPAEAAPVKRDEKRARLSKQTNTQQVDPDAFYQTIIDNNIFRLLNWKPPQRESAYTLLGTAIAADGSTATAYIQERESNRFYAVSVGQQVGEMTVKTITPKRVTLTQNGKSLTLAMSNSNFLNYRSNQSMPPRQDYTTPRTTNASPAKSGTTDKPTTPSQKISAASEWRKQLEEKASKICAERKRMMEYLQQHQNR